MKKIFPYPLLALSLAIMWALLTSSYSAGNLLLAAAIGLVVPFTMLRLMPEKAVMRNLRAMLKLGGIVLYDIIRSNFAVTAIILYPGKRERVSGFIRVPLQIRSQYGLAVLAIIITSTPGTLWVQYDAATGRLLLHVLDLVDENEWIDLIKNRYETLLMEIFE